MMVWEYGFESDDGMGYGFESDDSMGYGFESDDGWIWV
jgi:hypothetical protein